MPREIERKFLVRGDGWRPLAAGSVGIRQCYLASTPQLSIRLRIRDDGRAAITLKSAEKALDRAEYEYAIPLAEAEELLLLSGAPVLEKRRHDVAVGPLRWEVDVFAGRHAGLVIAEVELTDAAQEIAVPDWAGEEVTGDPLFYNEALAKA